MEIRQRDGTLKKAEMKIEQKSKANSKRAADLEYIVAAVNGDCIKARRKPYDVRFIAFKLAHVKTDDLYPLFRECLDYEKRGKGTFSKCFFGKLKVKPNA